MVEVQVPKVESLAGTTDGPPLGGIPVGARSLGPGSCRQGREAAQRTLDGAGTGPTVGGGAVATGTDESKAPGSVARKCDTGRVARLDLRLLAQRAFDLGHALDVQRRDFDEFDAPPKFYVTCSCGYAARVRRTEKAALEAGVFHLGKAVGETDGFRALNGVSVPGNAPGKRDSVRAG